MQFIHQIYTLYTVNMNKRSKEQSTMHRNTIIRRVADDTLLCSALFYCFITPHHHTGITVSMSARPASVNRKQTFDVTLSCTQSNEGSFWSSFLLMLLMASLKRHPALLWLGKSNHTLPFAMHQVGEGSMNTVDLSPSGISWRWVQPLRVMSQ